MLYVVIGSVILELFLFLPGFWRLRQLLAPVTALLQAFALGWLLVWQFNAFTIVIALLGAYQLVNILRITEGRLFEKRLRKSALRGCLSLIGLQLIVAGIWYLADTSQTSSQTIWQVFAFTQVGVAGIICLATIKNVVKLRFSWPNRHYSNSELPTVTVAIPARNETRDLADCLDSIVSSDYPKLEVLVLDDCSQDRTSEIIKRYAQAGVRFLHGSEPKENWIAKNQAYDQLFKAANGDYVLFCGVDTRLGIKTIRSLVTLALAKEKKMISVLPLRGGTSFGKSFIQPMRYWWELALPRKLFNRPPVLGTCWFVERAAITKAGGFGAVSQSVLPESYFAKKLISNNRYGFVRSSGDLSVTSNKGFQDQLDRAIRTHYPEVHRHIEQTALLSLLELIFLLSPFVQLITSFFVNGSPLVPVAIACTLLVLAHLLILSAIAQPPTLASLLNFPVIVLTEIILGNISMLKYEFSVVDWKGRNICIPVMRPVLQQESPLANLE